jgi:GTP-binding protein
MEIISAQYLISNVDWEKCPRPDMPEYAFIGRSNVGKSSLINMVTNHHKLAKTSGNPGKTQTINHFLVESTPNPLAGVGKGQWYLADLPGYGFAKVAQSQRQKWEKMIEQYLKNRTNLVSVFILIDSRISPQKIDIDFINQLGEWHIPFVILFTKSDKNTQAETSRKVKLFLKALESFWEYPPLYFITSATKKTGRKELLEYIAEYNTRFRAIT